MKSPEQIAMDIGTHMAACHEARDTGFYNELSVTSFDFCDYEKAVHKLLKDIPEGGLLPDDLLNKRIHYIASMNDSERQAFFEPGRKCCLTIIPVNNSGFDLKDIDQHNGLYLRFLIVEEDGRTTDGFGPVESYIFKMMPKEIREACTFSIDSADRESIVKAVKEKFQALRELLS